LKTEKKKGQKQITLLLLSSYPEEMLTHEKKKTRNVSIITLIYFNIFFK